MKKRIVSIFLVIALLLGANLYTPVYAESNGIQEKLDALRSVYYTGTYFTASGNAAHYLNEAESHINNIPSRGGLPAGSSLGLDGTSCWAFAQYCFCYIFGSNFYTAEIRETPVFGDAVAFNNNVHFAIYLGEDENNYYIYDANFADWGQDNDCRVRYWGALSKASWYITTTYHAKNYDSVNGTTSKPVTYANIAEGTYYLKNNANGEYLSVSYSQDAQGQNVNAWEYTGIADEQLAFTKADNGYKIRPLCCASRLVNAHGITVESGLNVNIWDDVNDASQWWGFEKVSGGYVVRNMMNPSCVLSISGVREIIVSAYSQADHQIWSIQNTVTFDANGGTGAPAVQFKNYEEPISLSNTVPVREGYAFLGWAFTSDAKTPFYEAGENYTLTSNNNYDLYAVWELRCEPDAHKWDAATCEKAKTCAICGQVEGEPQGHKWVEASCEKAKNCTACGKTEGEPLDHDWQEATCEKSETCSRCGKTDGEPLGHIWEDATCVQPKTCVTCGETEGETVPHKWEAATCEEAEYCHSCGQIKGDPLGHDYVNGVCTRCEQEDSDYQKVARGDMNKDGQVNSDDALYLLRNSMNPDRYPIEQNGDVNGDGIANSDDAIYLLRHTMSPERYPLS